MLCLCAVYSAVAVTCMQRHEHQSTMCAKLVADCKIHICDVRWARGQFMRQAGMEEDKTSSCYLWFLLFVYLYIYLLRNFFGGGPSTKGRFHHNFV